MMTWFRTVVTLVGKEWTLEWRGRELPALLICNALIMSVLVGAGVSSAVLDQTTTTKLFPMLLWLVFLFVATASMTRANEQELEARGFEGLLLAGVTGSQMYVAKVVAGWVLLSLAFLLCGAALGVVLDLDLSKNCGTLAAIGVGVSGALSSLLAILIGIASTSRMRGALLPLITLPLCFPLYFAGVEMTTEVVLRGSLDLSSPWPSIVLCANVIFFVLGINLFDFVLRD